MRALLGNKWFRFAVATVLWVLIFVVWMRNLWMLIGVIVIFDRFITEFFSRYVWHHHRRLMAHNHAYKVVADWVEAIVFSVVVASMIHIFLFQMFVIPSPSMEKSLLVGDYLYVSKVAYGPRMPNTPLSFPLVHNVMPLTGARSYSTAIRRPYKRLSGLKSIERGDVVVFNYPADTTMGRPVDKRENYVKRCVGLPGDSIRLASSKLYVNGVEETRAPGLQQFYYVLTNAPFSETAMQQMDITSFDIFDYDPSSGEYQMFLRESDLEKMSTMGNVVHVEQIERGYASFPSYDTGWTENDYGPVWVPAKGATVALTLDNLPLYRRIIDEYENNDLEVTGGVIYINGAAATRYTFAMDYYWMMGDNRQNSEDSRFWGFVPEDHVVGKASFVWLSLDKEKGWFDGKVRWGEMFRKIR